MKTRVDRESLKGRTCTARLELQRKSQKMTVVWKYGNMKYMSFRSIAADQY